jgi:heme-degrading monooxygenase HmoA
MSPNQNVVVGPTAATAVRATLHLRIAPRRAADFERAWRAVAAEVRRVPGNLRQALLRDPQDPGAVTITSDWSSEERFRAFEASARQHTLTAELRALRESAVMTVSALVLHVDGEASWRA